MKKLAPPVYLLKLILLFVVVTVGIGCRDDDEALPSYCIETPDLFPSCPNYDPCFRTKPVENADWEMVDSNYIRVDSAIAFIIDTADARRPRTVFRPVNYNPRAEYRWQLGSDPRIWETAFFQPPQGFFFNFEGPLEVTLEVTQPDTIGCLTEDETFKTSTRTIYLDNKPIEDYPILGDFTGDFLDRSGNIVETNQDLRIWQTDDYSFCCVFLEGIPYFDDCPIIRDEGVGLSGSYYSGVSSINAQNFTCASDYRPVLIVKIDPPTRQQLTVDIWYDDQESGEQVYRQFVGLRQ